jgi:hypothetical protein
MPSTWAWRIPSLAQGIFSVMCILILPFMPESPRWLVFQGRNSEAYTVLAQTYADGDHEAEVVKAQYASIVDTLEWERGQLRLSEIWRTRNARKRVLLACSAAVFSTIAGACVFLLPLCALLTE